MFSLEAMAQMEHENKKSDKGVPCLCGTTMKCVSGTARHYYWKCPSCGWLKNTRRPAKKKGK